MTQRALLHPITNRVKEGLHEKLMLSWNAVLSSFTDMSIVGGTASETKSRKMRNYAKVCKFASFLIYAYINEATITLFSGIISILSLYKN